MPENSFNPGGYESQESKYTRYLEQARNNTLTVEDVVAIKADPELSLIGILGQMSHESVSEMSSQGIISEEEASRTYKHQNRMRRFSGYEE